jgi:hypothetical protein
MICDRCSGLMVTEQSPDTIDEPVLPWSPSVRCLNCGNIEDPVIRLNRSRHHPLVLVATGRLGMPAEHMN